MDQSFSVRLDWRGGYRFAVDFEREGVPALQTDEAPPLGGGEGPDPALLLAAAVGNCMSSSLRHCLERAHLDLAELTTHVEGTLVRNERGRLRIGSLRVRLEPTLPPDQMERAGRCLEVFEEYCTVGQSVRDGIEVAVEVGPRA